MTRGTSRRAFLAGVAALGAAWPWRAEAAALAELPGDVTAPDFVLPGLDGREHRLADYRGQTVVVAFWALWCSPCRRELPALGRLRRKLRERNADVLAVNLGDDPERIASFVADHGVPPDLPIVLDREREQAVAWHITGLPVAFVVSPGGRLALGAIGERDWASTAIYEQIVSLAPERTSRRASPE